MSRVHICILIQLILISCVVQYHWSIGVFLSTLNMKLELDAIKLSVAWVLLLMLGL
jgi:hypothetical protein